VKLLNTNLFNFHQETSSLDVIESLWFQSKLTLEPKEINRGGHPDVIIKPTFSQTLLL
jgi:hypothetical protein